MSKICNLCGQNTLTHRNYKNNMCPVYKPSPPTDNGCVDKCHYEGVHLCNKEHCTGHKEPKEECTNCKKGTWCSFHCITGNKTLTGKSAPISKEECKVAQDGICDEDLHGDCYHCGKNMLLTPPLEECKHVFYPSDLCSKCNLSRAQVFEQDRCRHFPNSPTDTICNRCFKPYPQSPLEESSWEEEFDNLFPPDGDTINQILEYRGIYDCGKCFNEDEEERYFKPIKYFISQLLLKECHEAYIEGKIYERQALKEKIEGLKKFRQPETAAEQACAKCGFSNDHAQCLCQYNAALEDILSIIKGEK